MTCCSPRHPNGVLAGAYGELAFEDAGALGIPIGKLSLYSGCGGLHPATTLPILLDVGTDNQDCLADPLYIGWRHERVRGQEYDDFIEAFVSAVATGTLLAAINVTGVPLTEQRIAVLGAGSAGCGIASLIRTAMRDAGLSDEEAGRRFFMVDRDGLLVEGMTGLASFQLPFLQAKQATAGWALGHPDKIDLLDVVLNAKPTVLIGVSGQAGAFSEPVVRAMAACNKRPVIFPLSNPTSREEATPSDIEAWTEGRALIGVGSPFPPITRDGTRFKIDQTNNSYIFPGVGLGALAVGASRISDGMFMAAAKALAGASPTRDNPKHNLLPPVSSLRDVAMTAAVAVALQAHKEGLAKDVPLDTIEQRIEAKMWTPTYAPYRRPGRAGR